MAVSKATIKAELNALYTAAQAGMTDDDFADGMADIIKNAILSATVNVTSVTLVTPGSGSSGPGTGTLS